MVQEVKTYTKLGCSYCDALKAYLEKRKIEFQDFDVEDDEEKLKEMIEKSGQLGVPVILIGTSVVIGFDIDKIERLI